ncbi:hypothetical protein [Dyella mobilis]|uniref:Peptidase S24/S26A/S26B/S26C domain-containing protein n=1 Tax=Dyella mobilis TaxID=1849582 RepID=A0ABS2KP66_9GAMM|nr:hypothetical protein [Dyella mobilis]MBM7132263.1 hypothetical protein [Dyella mobilis]
MFGLKYERNRRVPAESLQSIQKLPLHQDECIAEARSPGTSSFIVRGRDHSDIEDGELWISSDGSSTELRVRRACDIAIRGDAVLIVVENPGASDARAAWLTVKRDKTLLGWMFSGRHFGR